MPNFVDLSRPAEVPKGLEERLTAMQQQLDLQAEQHAEVVEMVTRIAKVIGALKDSSH